MDQPKRRGRPRKMPAAAAAAADIEPDADSLDSISVAEIMGGKINMKKVGKQIRRGYKKHIQPVATSVAKAALPMMKAQVKAALPAALASAGVPPAAIPVLTNIGAEAAEDAARAGLNRSGLTEGAGVVSIMPVRRRLRPGVATQMPLMGRGVDPLQAESDLQLPVQMRSNAAAAANMMNLTQGVRRQPHNSPQTHALPPQMQSNTFTGMNVNVAYGSKTGRGLYGPSGAGLFLPGERPGRGLFM